MTTSTQSTSRYVIRYKDLKGILHEGNVYAHDVIKAQDMALELNAELKKRPHLISAILKENCPFQSKLN